MFRPVKLHQSSSSLQLKSEAEAAASLEARSLHVLGERTIVPNMDDFQEGSNVMSTSHDNTLSQHHQHQRTMRLSLNRISPRSMIASTSPENKRKLFSSTSPHAAAAATILQPPPGAPLSPRVSARVVLDPINYTQNHLHENNHNNNNNPNNDFSDNNSLLNDSGFLPSSIRRRPSSSSSLISPAHRHQHHHHYHHHHTLRQTQLKQHQQETLQSKSIKRQTIIMAKRDGHKQQQQQQHDGVFSLTYSGRTMAEMSSSAVSVPTPTKKIELQQKSSFLHQQQQQQQSSSKRTGLDVLFSLPITLPPLPTSPVPSQQQQQSVPLTLTPIRNDTITIEGAKQESQTINKTKQQAEMQSSQLLMKKEKQQTATMWQSAKVSKIQEQQQQQQQQRPSPSLLATASTAHAQIYSSLETPTKEKTTTTTPKPNSDKIMATTPPSKTAQKNSTTNKSNSLLSSKPTVTTTTTTINPFAEYVESRRRFESNRDELMNREGEGRRQIVTNEQDEWKEISSFETEQKQFETMMDRLEEERRQQESARSGREASSSKQPSARHHHHHHHPHHHTTIEENEPTNCLVVTAIDDCNNINKDETQQARTNGETDIAEEMPTDEAIAEPLNLVHECSFIPNASSEFIVKPLLTTDDDDDDDDDDDALEQQQKEEFEIDLQQHQQQQPVEKNDSKQERLRVLLMSSLENEGKQQPTNPPATSVYDDDGEDMSGDEDMMMMKRRLSSTKTNMMTVSFINVSQEEDEKGEKDKKETEQSNIIVNNDDDPSSTDVPTSVEPTASTSWKPLVKKKIFTPLGDRVLDDQEEAEISVHCSGLPLYDVFRAEIRNGRRRWLCGDPILVSRVLTFAFGGPLASRDKYPSGTAMIELAMKYVDLLKEFVVGAVLLSFLQEGDLADTRHPVVRVVMHSIVKRYFEDFPEFAKCWKRQAILHRQLSNPRAQHAFRTPNGLLFSGAFDGGNLAHVEQHPGLFGSPPVYQVWITSDAELVSGFRFWFQFTVTNLHLVPNLHERKECLCIRVMNVIFRESFDHIEKVRPVWSSDSSPLEWHPCAEARIDYERTATECRLSFYIPPTYPPETQVLHVAFNVPYNVGSLARSLIHWDTMAQMEQNKKYVRFSVSHLTMSSPDERPIYCLEITGSAKMQRRRQRSVFITGRANAGDHSASHAMHAIITFLLFDRSYNAKHLRECFCFFILPMINPDGIARGHSRLDGRGENLNTTYDLPHPKRHPAQNAFEYRFWKTHRQFGRPAMYIDLQSQIPSSNCFIYGNPGGTNGEGSFELAQHGMIFARAFERNVPRGTFSAETNFLPLQALDEISGSSRRHYGPHVEHCYTLHIPHIYDSQINHSGKSLWHPSITHETSENVPSSVPIVKMFADYGRGVLQALADITQILMTPKNPPERPQIRGKRFGGYIKEYVTDPDLQEEVDNASKAEDPEGGSGIKFFKVAKSQLERDYVLLCDRSRSMSIGTRWADAENAISLLAPQICEFDPDGITIIFFDHEPIKFENVQSGEEVRDLFERHPPRGTTDLALALDMAFVDHFSGYRGSTTILVITDGKPNNTDQVKEVIIEAANTLGCDAELSISLVQIGANAQATQYLKELDDELSDAKYDIVDAITAEEVKDISFNELIARSMMD